MNKMNNFRKITKLNGNKKFLLKRMGYESIKEAKQYIDEETNKNNTNEKVNKNVGTCTVSYLIQENCE
jgi:hypothetical protein